MVGVVAATAMAVANRAANGNTGNADVQGQEVGGYGGGNGHGDHQGGEVGPTMITAMAAIIMA